MIPTTSLMDVTQPTAYMKSVQISASTTSSIQVVWTIGKEAAPSVQGFRVHYQKIASTYVQHGPLLPSTSTGYNIKNLVADTFYKVCVVMFRNDSLTPVRDCVDAMTTNWHIPVSIGSSIGAILALSMIVLIVLVSRCPAVVRWRGKQNKHARKYDSMSSHFHDDHYEFSDTITHGQDDEFISESEASSYPYELTNHSFRFDSRLPERLCNGNRNHLTVQHSFKSPKSRQPTHISNHHTHRYHPYSVSHDTPAQNLLNDLLSDQTQGQDLNHNHQGACESSELQQQQQQQQSVDHDQAGPLKHSEDSTRKKISSENSTICKNENSDCVKPSVYTIPQKKESETLLPNGYEMKEIKRDTKMEEKPLRKMLETCIDDDIV